MKNTKKLVALLLALCLVLGGIIGGTLAYLMTETDPVTNTFVAGKIGTLTLTESDDDKKFMVIPGVDIKKDPTVTFSGNNVAAYVFVKVEQNGWQVSEDGMTYSCVGGKVTWTISAEWTHLGKGVYYREVAADTDTANIAETEKYGIIAGNTITVPNTVTKGDLAAFTEGTSLIFTAYAVQQDTFAGAKAAWNATFGQTNPLA